MGDLGHYKHVAPLALFHKDTVESGKLPSEMEPRVLPVWNLQSASR